MKLILTIVFISIFQTFICQRLNDDIKFEKLSFEDSLKIEGINKLLPSSKFIVKKECNSYLLKKIGGCFEDYIIIYIHNSQPILIDEKTFDSITALISDGTEVTTNYIMKTRTYVINWEENKFISKQKTIDPKRESTINNKFNNKYEIEELIKRN